MSLYPNRPQWAALVGGYCLLVFALLDEMDGVATKLIVVGLGVGLLFLRLSRPAHPIAWLSRHRRAVAVVVALATTAFSVAVWRANQRESRSFERALDSVALEDGWSSDPFSPQRTGAKLVTLQELITSYETNEFAAEKEYASGSVEFTLPVDSLGKNDAGQPRVWLKTPAVPAGFIRADFEPSQADALAGLRKGSPATVNCLAAWRNHAVVLTRCLLRPVR